jgi:hypothetical protein
MENDMSPPQVSVVSLDDGQLIELINRTESSLLFVSPGVSTLVADALAKKWLEIGPDAVSILIDVDPEVCRLGYGLEPYRYKGQRYTTVIVRAPRSFVDKTLWPEYVALQKALYSYLSEATERIIREEVFRDAGEAAERAG